jgi:hypothetical protein
MFSDLLTSLRSVSLSKAASIINWVCWPPIIIAGAINYFLENGAIFHWIPLLAFAILGFGYAFLLSIDSSRELFFDKPLFDGVPRWLWRWICVGWGASMLVAIYFLHISPAL